MYSTAMKCGQGCGSFFGKEGLAMAAQHMSDLEHLVAAAKRTVFLGWVTVTATARENLLTITMTDDGVGPGVLSEGDGGTIACLTLPMQSEEG